MTATYSHLLQLYRPGKAHRPGVLPRILALALALSAPQALWATPRADPSFEISFPASVHAQPITGRLLLMISRTDNPEVRLQVGWVTSPPVFGLDLNQLQPDHPALIDTRIPGYPLRSLRDLPSGDYYVQALLNVYTDFHRADGHVVWLHMDQGEGQQFNVSPGNLYSSMQRLHLDALHGYRIKLSLSEVIPTLSAQTDTPWIKHVRIQSKLLTAFWGRPMFLGATLLLPRTYASQPDRRYPVIYEQTHFGDSEPFHFAPEDSPEEDWQREYRRKIGVESGHEFYQSWLSPDFPQLIAVTFQHPTPYYDDSYAVNSVNVGPYGDALVTELIPYLEAHFRIVPESYARVLTGISTGGWESLALQLLHPGFFGGAWIGCPDPVDFRRYGLLNIYEDDNAFIVTEPSVPAWALSPWAPIERTFERGDDGQILATLRQLSRLEDVLGSQGRSGGQIAVWNAVYGPVGKQGYPRPLWDGRGNIDKTVAAYMRDHGYDLRAYAQEHWTDIGPQLLGKLHFYCGEMDSFFLNLGVYLFQDFLKDTQNPHYTGSFEYGRPMKPHAWQPSTNAELVRQISRYVEANRPPPVQGAN